MQIKTEVKATISQIKQLIAEKYNISLDFDLEIGDEIGVGDDKVQIGDFVDDEWVTVPSNWVGKTCPTLLGHAKIEVQYRNGKIDKGVASSWTLGWKQRKNNWEIVKYREVTNTK